ncbi:MAG: hypothetical protein ACYTG0_02480 [Planctomycetota bacterium]
MVAELASQHYDYERNWRQAESAAARFQLRAVKDVLAVMVYPPPVRSAIPAWVWLPRVQLAAAQLVARIETAHGIPVRESSLADVVMGPIDWTIDAAVLALTHRARSDPKSSAEVRSLFAALLDRIPSEGYWSCAETTFRNWLLLPNLPDNERAEIEQMVAGFDAA